MKLAAFQAKWAGSDAESVEVRKELVRLFPERADGGLPGWEDDEEDLAELAETLEDLAQDFDDGILADPAVPDALRSLLSFLVFEECVRAKDGREWALYGIDDFAEMNGEEGIVGDFKDEGRFPAGVFAFGQDLYVDTRAEAQPQAGAVLHAINADVENAKVLAPSLAAFLASCR